MASAALWPYSVERLFLFVVSKRLRAFRNYFFTGGVVEGNGSCRAAFRESAARRGSTASLYPHPALRFCRGIQRIASYDRSSIGKHLTHPRSLEACMTCEKYTLVFVKIKYIFHFIYFAKSGIFGTECSQRFHGALFSANNFSNIAFSRMLSIHCQKPS